MTFNLIFLSIHRLNQVLKSVCEIGSWCWSGSVTERGPSTSRGWLRRFLLLKLMTVLLFPNGAGLPLLVCCLFSLRALLFLHSPHISTKPSTVLLGQLALTDSLVLLHWGLRLGATLVSWLRAGCDVETGLMTEEGSVQWKEAEDRPALHPYILTDSVSICVSECPRWLGGGLTGGSPADTSDPQNPDSPLS
ncbi:uncharacterized protein LOC127374990 [Scomber scombrus]|uniref:Uncharacterized protein LOC127374990 n=1 Tax=Scomber scombrus TaxID=13677 RepID=A0AAV1PSM1_SCOSC